MKYLKKRQSMLTNPAIRRFYLILGTKEQIFFDERAAYLEYAELLPRARAEHRAYIEILKLRRAKYSASA
jgi:hypothetical protein